MLVDESVEIDAAEHKRLTDKAGSGGAVETGKPQRRRRGVSHPGGEGVASPLGVDSLSMWQVTAGLPEQVAEAIEAGRSVAPSRTATRSTRSWSSGWAGAA